MWANVFSKYSKTELSAVCDLRKEKVNRIAKETGAKKATTSYEKLLKMDLDAICIFTPGPLHVRHAIAAMEAGKNVLSAVPTAWTLDECQQLINAVEGTGMKYMLAETPCYEPSVAFAKKMYESGDMGEIFFVQSTGFQDLGGPAIGHDYFSQDSTPDGIHTTKGFTWRYGMPPFNYIDHSSGPIISVLGKRMIEVTAYGWGYDPESFEEKYGVKWSEPYKNPYTFEAGFFRMEGGVLAKISIGWVVAGGKGGGRGTQWWGTKISYLVENGNNFILTKQETKSIVKPKRVKSLEPSLQSYALAENSPFIVQDFAESIINDTKPPIDVYTAVSFTAPGICAHQSAIENKTIKIPDFGKKN
jgi:predicted dehydrogenase